MTDNKIAEIRARHEEGGIDKLPMAAFAEAHHDRAFLLVEVERLRSALEVTSDSSDLSPCPFCGGGETRIDETKTSASLLEQYKVISCYVRHWCGGFAPGAQSATIQVRGRNRSDAIAAWNRRAVLEGKP
jgi:hypothetical protein